MAESNPCDVKAHGYLNDTHHGNNMYGNHMPGPVLKIISCDPSTPTRDDAGVSPILHTATRGAMRRLGQGPQMKVTGFHNHLADSSGVQTALLMPRRSGDVFRVLLNPVLLGILLTGSRGECSLCPGCWAITVRSPPHGTPPPAANQSQPAHKGEHQPEAARLLPAPA